MATATSTEAAKEMAPKSKSPVDPRTQSFGHLYLWVVSVLEFSGHCRFSCANMEQLESTITDSAEISTGDRTQLSNS
jgi:Fe-S-cluster formation regulator IscX/YfhJ